MRKSINQKLAAAESLSPSDSKPVSNQIGATSVRRRPLIKGLGATSALLLPASAMMINKAQAQSDDGGGKLTAGINIGSSVAGWMISQPLIRQLARRQLPLGSVSNRKSCSGGNDTMQFIVQFCRTAVAACVGPLLLMVPAQARAQYHLTNLVSNQIDEHAPNTDPLLVNAWGLARGAMTPWWVSDNLSGWSTIYDATGTPQSLKVLIPTAGNGPASPTGLNGPGTPTGVVFNGSQTDFQIQGNQTFFIFATLDGTISAWAPGVNANQAMIAVDNSAKKAMYTGLAITNKPSGNFLYAADNTNNHIDMFNGAFTLMKSFGDPTIP